MSKLNLTLCQSDLAWEDIDANLNAFEKRFESIKAKTDIIILPEMFSTGFSMEPFKIAENWPGRTMSWMKDNAQKYNCVLAGSIMVKVAERYLNRFVWVDPSGNIEFYDKRHLFQMGGEHEVFHAGSKQLIISYKGWRIAPFVCYDLRFPVWSRNRNNYDLAIYVANWPAARSHVWEKLLMARAIENQCYVAGVNRVGIDGRDLFYDGNSLMINARGEVMSDFKKEKEEMLTFEIDKADLLDFRNKFPVFDDADDFEIKL
ncbi:MAG: amidohydrolase [Salinivirgaceae bacterium]|nr:MAG: amidohydrolase [Salinivirgaceae bacterium]